MKITLSESILFSGLNSEELELIEQIGHHLEFDKNQYLFFQDDPAERLFVVQSGRVRIFKTSPEGKEQVLMMAGPGDSFGEAAFFSGGNYPAGAMMEEAGQLISFPRVGFTKLMQEHSSLAMNMIARLSMLLRHLTRVIQRISLEDVDTRLAGYILGMTENKPGRAGDTGQGQTKTIIILSEKKMLLASILGTIPETLSRSFARLSKQGAISVKGQEITILNLPKLIAIAAGGKI